MLILSSTQTRFLFRWLWPTFLFACGNEVELGRQRTVSQDVLTPTDPGTPSDPTTATPPLAVRTEAYVSVLAQPDGSLDGEPSVDFSDHAATRYNRYGGGRELETHDNCYYQPTQITGGAWVPGAAGLYQDRWADINQFPFASLGDIRIASGADTLTLQEKVTPIPNIWEYHEYTTTLSDSIRTFRVSDSTPLQFRVEGQNSFAALTQEIPGPGALNVALPGITVDPSIPPSPRARRTTLPVRHSQDLVFSWSGNGMEKIYVLLESNYSGYTVQELPPVGQHREGTLFCEFDARAGQGVITAAQVSLLVLTKGPSLGRYTVVGSNRKTLVQGDVQLSLEVLRYAQISAPSAERAAGNLQVVP